jgi:hypothetical protein
LLAALDSISVEDSRQCFQQWEQYWDCCIQSQGGALKGLKFQTTYILKKFFVTIQEIFWSSLIDEAEYGVLME